MADGPRRDQSALLEDLHVSARDLLESVPDAVVGVDREGRIAFVNVQTEKLFGYERSEMLGQHVEILLPDRLKGAHARHREVYHTTPTTRPMGVGLNLVARRRDRSVDPDTGTLCFPFSGRNVRRFSTEGLATSLLSLHAPASARRPPRPEIVAVIRMVDGTPHEVSPRRERRARGGRR